MTISDEGRGCGRALPAQAQTAVDHVYAHIDDLALFVAHIPREDGDRQIDVFAIRLREQWKIFAGEIAPGELDCIVEDIVGRIRRRREAIESVPAGAA